MFDRAILTLLQIFMTMNYICIDFDKGYSGPNCDFKCRFPLYGYDCQSVCDCNVTYCDHVNGCIQSSGGKISYYFIVPSVTYEIFEGFRSMLWYTVLLLEFKVKWILGKKVMFIVIFYESFFKTFSNDKNQLLGFFLKRDEIKSRFIKWCFLSRISGLFYNALRWQDCRNRSHRKTHHYRQ